MKIAMRAMGFRQNEYQTCQEDDQRQYEDDESSQDKIIDLVNLLGQVNHCFKLI